MSSIFGPENKRENQKMLVQEIDFYEGENFEVIARLEMCDDCEWNSRLLCQYGGSGLRLSQVREHVSHIQGPLAKPLFSPARSSDSAHFSPSLSNSRVLIID